MYELECMRLIEPRGNEMPQLLLEHVQAIEDKDDPKYPHEFLRAIVLSAIAMSYNEDTTDMHQDLDEDEDGDEDEDEDDDENTLDDSQVDDYFGQVS